MTNSELQYLLSSIEETERVLEHPPTEEAAGTETDSLTLVPLFRIAEGLVSGFTAQEEQEAKGSPSYQRAVTAAWRIKAPTPWMIARFIAEGASFPFREAMQRYLEGEESSITRMLLRWHRIKGWASAIREAAWGSASWEDLRYDLSKMCWVAGLEQIEAPVMSMHFADEVPDLYSVTADIEDGTTVTLHQFDHDPALHVFVTLPDGEVGLEAVEVVLVGSVGEPISARVELAERQGALTGHAELCRFEDFKELFAGSGSVLIVRQ